MDYENDTTTRPAITEHQKWSSELRASHKEMAAWHERAQKVLDVYMDKRGMGLENARKFNLFNTNVGILQSALFARIPKPDVQRRFKDANDHFGRVASNILQRALITELTTDGYFTSIAKNIIKDRLVPGAGVAWVRYVPSLQEPMQLTESTTEELAEDPSASPIITEERTPIEHVVWKDVRWSPCRTWNECRWIARRVYLSEEELTERFGEEVTKRVSFDVQEEETGAHRSTNDSEPQNNVVQTVEVWEIWCKTSKKVYFYCDRATDLLGIRDDPFGLPNFFPTPAPLIGTHTTQNYIPMPDYVLVQDQYEELNVLNSRLSNLVRACKVAGAYDAGNPAIGQIFSPTSPETQLVPVDRWDAFAEKGGLKGTIDFVPIDQIAAVIGQLNAAREIIKAQIYELTGISDIIRGQTSQYETLGAQNIKAQYAGLRLSSLQSEVAEFFSELVRIKAFLMVKFYEPQRLLQKAGPMLESDAPYVEGALAMLKDELLANTHVEVSVDSLQAQNDLQDKQDRAEVVTAVANLLREAVPAATQVPQLAPLMMHLVKFSVSSFKGAREIEGLIDQELQKLVAQGQQAQGQEQEKPDPAMVQAQMKQAEMQAAAQAKQAELQADVQVKMARIQADVEIEKAKLAQQAQFKERELAIEEQRLQLEMLRLQQNGQIESAKLAQKQTPSVVLGNAGADEDRIAQMIATMQQSTIEAITALANREPEPAQIVVERDENGRLVGTIQ